MGATAFVPAPTKAFARCLAQPQSRRNSRVVCSDTAPKSSVGVALSKVVSSAVATAMLSAALFLDPNQMTMSLVPPAAMARGGGSTLSGSSQRVIKDAESLLRWGLPISNKPVRQLQGDLEQISYLVRPREWGKIDDALRRATAVTKKPDKLLVAVPADRKQDAEQLLTSIQNQLPELRELVAGRNADQILEKQQAMLSEVGRLEELMVKEFPFVIPSEYDDLPRLLGRATVEMKIAKADGVPFDIDGTLYDGGNLVMVVDGYNAPLTAGNFVDLVNKGFYDQMPILRSDGFVIQTGDPDPEGPLDGYIDPNTKKVRTIPLEVFASSDKAPTYSETLEEGGRGATQTRLPFSSYGTLAMAREEFVNDSASSQYFWFLFEPDLTPAGRNLLDGRYTVFGYTTSGNFLLKDYKAGDLVVSAKVVAGNENLVVPKSAVAAEPST